MTEKKEFTLTGSENRPFMVDIRLTDTPGQPIVVFAHGFKGYKDWGHWNMIADFFASHRFNFLKFNFSHNGGTVNEPIDFPDLEAFGINRYSWELNDLNTVLDYVANHAREWNAQSEIYLIGHSRGGGIAMLGAAHPSVKKLVTWAAVSDFVSRLPDKEALEEWKQQGVRYIVNGRTKQKMPMYYSFVEDLLANKDKLDIIANAGRLKIPALIVHGSEDEAVDVKEAEVLHSAITDSTLEIIEGAGHTFGGKHPWTESALPEHSIQLVDKTIAFLKREP